MGAILFTVAMKVASRQRNAILATLRRQLWPTRLAPGCRSCRILTDCEDSASIVHVSEWAEQADLDAYLRTEETRVLLETMEAASRPPELRFDTIAETRGMEVITAARMESSSR